MDRFWSKVKKSDGCWEWTAGKDSEGYGHFWFERKTIRATRMVWFLTHGKWPDANIFVCHTCDNPKCVKPEHLFLGTNSENMLNASEKRRIAFGSKHHKTKLTPEQVNKIREEYAKGGGGYYLLAKKYGIHPTTVSSIVKGFIWKKVE